MIPRNILGAQLEDGSGPIIMPDYSNRCVPRLFRELTILMIQQNLAFVCWALEHDDQPCSRISLLDPALGCGIGGMVSFGYWSRVLLSGVCRCDPERPVMIEGNKLRVRVVLDL